MLLRQGEGGRTATDGLGGMKRWTALFCIFFITFIGVAQAVPRDYSISLPRVSYTPDGASAVVTFSVANQGGDAVEESQVIIAENQTGNIEIRERLPILAAEQERQYSIELQLADLPGDDLFFKIEAGIDQYELAGSPIARNNTQLFRINKAAARDAVSADPSDQSRSTAASRYDLFIPIINLGIDFRASGIQLNDNYYTGGELLRGAGLVAVTIFCLWLLSLILRLIFRRPPKFEIWQPPYNVDTWHDPNSVIGRRQGWQFHAQNSSINAACAPDQVTVVKRLLDRQGVILGGWKVKAMCTVQYDIYGRINRTEVVMPHNIINQLNRVVRRAPTLANEELRKKIMPIARRLSKYALGPVEKQNLMLPFALDMRFEGIEGEARVLFELYQCRSSAWHLIDQWEPEMGHTGTKVPEHFAFTLNGQLPGEKKRDFKQRLRDDVTQLLAGMFYHHQAEEGSKAAPATDAPFEAPAQEDEESRTFADLLEPDDETDPGSRA